MCNVPEDEGGWYTTQLGHIVGNAILIGMALSALAITGFIVYGVYSVVSTFLNG